MGLVTLVKIAILGIALSAPVELLHDYTRHETPLGPLYTWGASADQARELGRTVAGAARDVESRLGHRLQQSITAVFTPDSARFREAVHELTGGARTADNVIGVAIPSRRVLVMRGGLELRYGAFGDTLRHELAHLVIHAERRHAIPRFLDEGLATWASGQVSDSKDDAYMSLLARTGGLYSFAALATEFPEEHRASSAAYLQSSLLVEYLVHLEGEEVVPRLVVEVGDENPIADLAVIAKVPADELEKRFAAWVAHRHHIVWSLLSVLNVWTISALLAVAAIARYLVRRRRARRQWTAEEEAEDRREAAMGGAEA